MSRPLIAVLCLACAVAVGNVYFPQALIDPVAGAFGVSASAAAAIVSATQLGYALGIFLIVPLGDRLPGRRLVLILLGASAAGLAAAGAAPRLSVLTGASLLVGLTTVFAQVICALAAGMVAPDRRGQLAGTLLSGSIFGILLARGVAGVLATHVGWRAPYFIAAAMCAVLAAALARALPAGERHAGRWSLAEPLRLVAREPALRRSAFYQASAFAGFTAAWAGIALELTPQGVGALALVGVLTMVATPLAGRAADRHGPDRVSRFALAGGVGAAPVLAVDGLVPLAIGTLMLDVAMQCGMTANVARFYALPGRARNRMNAGYMTCAYLGGTAGSLLATAAYGVAGWAGVVALVGLAPLPALLASLSRLHQPGLVREDHGLDAVTQAELAEDPGHVGLDRRLGDDEPRGDLGVGEPAGDRAQNLELAIGERVQARGPRGRRASLGQPVGVGVEQPAGDAGGDDGVPARHGADPGEQVVRRRVLQEKPARTRAQP
jgi:predicted MFS family arabinose efflux permease